MMTAHVKLALATNTIDRCLRHSLWRIERVLKEYNPEQPREPEGSPEGGQWVSAAGGQTETRNESEKPFTVAARLSKQSCERQYERDIFQCKIVGIANCDSQAMERYAACLNGRQIPPFNY